MCSRRRPLHTCGVSFVAIVRGAYTRAQCFNEPFSTLTEKIARIGMLVSIVDFAVKYHYHLLTFLSFVDDHILLALENSVEAICPASKHVFNTIDRLVAVVETLPSTVDAVADKLDLIIHQIPFLYWALACAISCLNFWISILTHQRMDSTKEKEIGVDISSEDSVQERAIPGEAEKKMKLDDPGFHEVKEDFSPSSASSESEVGSTGCSEAEIEVGSKVAKGCTYKDALKKGKKITYKEVLEKGRKEDIQENPKCDKATKEKIENEEDSGEDLRSSEVNRVANRDAGTKKNIEGQEGISREESELFSSATQLYMEGEDENAQEILALFETAWLMKPGDQSKESPMSRNASYQW
ncbi:hypothetical protein Tsubulata_016461 [Turnera subulata]|uniref:Uncharacterized protein n=1 Tax=Turnera subulata TaxID=218843 RepID=A0A9Q0JKE3_9ROSI|nr:hypothetical protein Tsubulata_016461 [Turnera subulata]